MAMIEVTSFQLTDEGHVVDTLTNLMLLHIRMEYRGGPTGIHAGDTITVGIDNDSNDLFSIFGYGNHNSNIYGDGDIGKVGTRDYINAPSGNYHLNIEFNDGFSNYYGEPMPDDITGWLETPIYVLYKDWVQQPTPSTIQVFINGEEYLHNVNLQPGGGPGPEWPDTPGPIIGKSGRYGAYSGNLGDFPEVEFNDYLNFEPIRWSLQVGYQNLTWRDLRATDGTHYFTTDAALAFSNNNPTGPRYQSSSEPYLMPYAEQQGHPINAPFHHENCVLEDYLVVGRFGSVISSAHEYAKESLRIIRVLGREKNDEWWGKDAFRVLADSNFLKYAPDEPIDRYHTDLYFPGHRGLTIDEFLAQMHAEGQLLDRQSAEDILTFVHVNNGLAPGAPDPGDTTQIPHFRLMLGNMRFNSDPGRSVNLVSFDNTVIHTDASAQNLPYGYLVYYDTRATEAILDHEGFHYNNSASFRYDYETHTVASVDMWIKLEDGSGGSGHTTEMRMRKVDEHGEPLQGVRFTLTQTDILPPHIREAFTTINGTASFTLQLGTYVLEELPPLGSGLAPIAPMELTITNYDEMVNLKELLEGTDYPDWDKLIYEDEGDVNIITNYEDVPPTPEPDICGVIADVVSSIAKQEEGIAQLLNAEAEKLRAIIRRDGATFEEIMQANCSAIKLIDSATRFEMALHAKLSALPIGKCL